MFIMKLNIKIYFKIRFGGRRGEDGKRVTGIKRFPLKYKRISRKLNDIFYWIHREKLITCQALFPVLIEFFITSFKICYFRIFLVCLSERHFRNKSCANVRVSVKRSLLKLGQLVLVCNFLCLSKTSERIWVHINFLSLL